MDAFTIAFWLVAVATFLLTLVVERKLILVLISHKVGQIILDIGPRWHKHKEGTPTMGGIGFILPVMLVMAGYFVYTAVAGVSPDFIPLALTLAFAICNGAIGFVDDYSKLIKKQNEGLTAKQKLFLQIVIAAAYVTVMAYTGNLSTAVHIPFTAIRLQLGWLWYPIAVLILVGVVNGANLTDGIDGLCSSVSAVVGAFFAVVAFVMLRPELAIFPATVIGGTVGFLMYNFYPAKIFMGDTGSLYLGGAVVGMAFLIEEPLIIMIAGIIYLIEVASVILQVGYFKITHGKRIFKMAPIHHHFEKCGWSEVKIVGVFTLITAIACVLAYLGL